MTAVGKKPKILLIKPILPYPPDKGTRVVSFQLIQALENDFDVTVLARLTDGGQETFVEKLEEHCSRVVTVPAPNRKSVFHRIGYKFTYLFKSLVFKRSLKSLYDCPGVFIAAARDLSRENFDLVIIEYWQLFCLIPLFPRENTILLTHDIDILVNREISLLERNLLKKLAAVRRWLLERQEEMTAYRSVSRVLALTERDKVAVERLCGRGCEVAVLPFGVDMDYFAPAGSERSERNQREILFVGAMNAPFNRDAMDYFIHRIYPLVDELGGCTITIVGGELPKELRFFAKREEVDVVGHVRDIRPYLHRAHCLIVPLRFAGGLRVRILEAMAARIPIICTGIAIAGLPFEPDRDYLLANTPVEYERQLQRLFEDKGLAATLTQNAASKVSELYSRADLENRIRTLFFGFMDNE